MTKNAPIFPALNAVWAARELERYLSYLGLSIPLIALGFSIAQHPLATANSERRKR
jgi:hypothetical protein